MNSVMTIFFILSSFLINFMEKKLHKYIINVGMALILLIILTFCGHYVNYSTKTKQNIQ